MNRRELAALIADHGEMYTTGVGYLGCDCGLTCGSLEHADHLTGVVLHALGRGPQNLSSGVNAGQDGSPPLSGAGDPRGTEEVPDKAKDYPSCAAAPRPRCPHGQAPACVREGSLCTAPACVGGF